MSLSDLQSGFQTHVAHPWRTVALVLVLVVLLLAWFGKLRYSASKRWLMALLRGTILAALLLACAGLFLRGTTARRFGVSVLDESASAKQAASRSEAASADLAKLGGTAQSAQLAFAAETTRV